MSELEEILEKDGKKQNTDRFNVHRDYVDEIMNFVWENGIRVQKATYETKYICPDGIHSGRSTSQVTPDIYLLETKYGQIKITESIGYYGGRYVKVEYFYSSPEAKQEIRRLFHAEEERVIK